MPDVHGEEEHASYVGIPTFIHAPLAITAAELKQMEADIAIIGAPAEMVIYRPGARFGPRAIRQAGYVEHPNDYIYHMELEVHPTRVLKVVDFGDAACPPFSIERSHQAIQAKVAEALEADAVPIVLGGDHSVTLPSATAVAGKYGFGNVGIVHFDAHADTWDSVYGSLVSHGSPMRRLIEAAPSPARTSSRWDCAVTPHHPELLDWMRGQGMRWHQMSEIEQRGFDAVLGDAIGEAQDGPDHITSQWT